MSNDAAESPSAGHRPPTCAKFGCSDPSNGVAPYGYCATHLREYLSLLAIRSRHESFVRLSLAYAEVVDDDERAARLRDGADGALCVLAGQVDDGKSVDHKAGRVLDAIQRGAGELLFVASLEKGTAT